MKTKNQYPDWVEKYRSKGHTIRKVRDGYGLYKCTSVYIPGASYPKSKQVYLGMITEDEGFIPKKTTLDHPTYIEYGLSNFIWLNFKRDIKRSAYDGDEILARLGIIMYIFGSVKPVMIKASSLFSELSKYLFAFLDNDAFCEHICCDCVEHVRNLFAVDTDAALLDEASALAV